MDTEQAETQEPKGQQAHFQLVALPTEHLRLVKGLLCTWIWAQASIKAQSQDNTIWRIEILHFCLKTQPLYFSLTIFPMPWLLPFISHSFCFSSKCFKHLTIFSGIQSCTDLPHKSTLSNPSYANLHFISSLLTQKLPITSGIKLKKKKSEKTGNTFSTFTQSRESVGSCCLLRQRSPSPIGYSLPLNQNRTM